MQGASASHCLSSAGIANNGVTGNANAGHVCNFRFFSGNIKKVKNRW